MDGNLCTVSLLAPVRCVIDILAMKLPTARINRAGQDVLQAWRAAVEAGKSPLASKLTSCTDFRVTEQRVGWKIAPEELRVGGEWIQGETIWKWLCAFVRPSRSGHGALIVHFY